MQRKPETRIGIAALTRIRIALLLSGTTVRKGPSLGAMVLTSHLLDAAPARIVANGQAFEIKRYSDQNPWLLFR